MAKCKIIAEAEVHLSTKKRAAALRHCWKGSDANMINSAVRRSLLENNERKRSSVGVDVSGALSRQVERICTESDDDDGDSSSSSHDHNAKRSLSNAAAISASLGLNSSAGPSARIHPSVTVVAANKESGITNSSSFRKRSSSVKFPIRHTIAQKLRAREELTDTQANKDQGQEDKGSGFDDDGDNDDDESSIPDTLPTHAATSNHWRRTAVDGGHYKGTFYVPSKKPWFILLPHTRFRTAWDVFMAWLLSILAFYIPFRVCFYFDEDPATERQAIFWIELAADCLFAIDIVLNFLTAYGDAKTKRIVVDPKKIARNYLKGFFFVDVIATFPFGLVLSHPAIGLTNKVGKFGRLPKLLKFLRAAKLLKLMRLQQFISRLETEYNIHHGVARMVKVISLVFLVTHVVACFFYLIGLSGGNDDEDGGWIYREMYHDKPVASRYVASMYWAFSTLTTVGYGDISARTPQEQAFSMMMMLTGVSWYAIIVSSMSSIMSTFDAQNKAIRDKMLSVNAFVRSAKLPLPLAQRVRSYFEFRSSQRTFLMSDHFNADALLEELGSALRTDILLHLERDLIAKIPFFAGKVPQFVADTISMLQPMVFQVGDTIVREGSQADEMYFLVRGRATVLYGEKEVLTIEAGSYFGEIGCIMGGIRRASIKAVTVVELQALSRRNLNILLNEYPEVAEELKGVAKHRAKLAKGSSSSSSSKPSVESVPPPSSSSSSSAGAGKEVATGSDTSADNNSGDLPRGASSLSQPIAPSPLSNNSEEQGQRDPDADNARKMTILLAQLESTLQQLNALRSAEGSEGVT